LAKGRSKRRIAVDGDFRDGAYRSEARGNQGSEGSVFFLVSRCIAAALGHKKADGVYNTDAVDREGVRDLIRGEKR
jgi:hypothetical protein